jgi:predicted ATP-grasp superfamily ATP-dependent carboligase
MAGRCITHCATCSSETNRVDPERPAHTEGLLDGMERIGWTSANSRSPHASTLEAPKSDNYDILILDAATKQSLACTRSLGRAGLRVAMGECFAQCDPRLPVVAFRSRYSNHNAVFPSFAVDPDAFATSVVQFAREHSTRVVLPTMDGSIAALLPYRQQLAAFGCALALAEDSVLDVANDKLRTLEVAQKLGLDYPRTRLIESLDDVPAVLAELEFPIVLKPTISWPHLASKRQLTMEVMTEAEALSAIRSFLSAGVSVLAQQWACGPREGVTMFVSGGQVQACCAHVAYRTSPPLGGASVMRASIAVPPDIYSAALRLVTAIGLEGLCEVEFRRDADNRPLLMEINARLAGTIENSVRSGIDFPFMIWQHATGKPVTGVDTYRTGVRTRWLRGDLRWFRENYDRAGRPDSTSRATAVWIFGTEFFRTWRYDCIDRRDLGPGIAELRNTASAVRRSLTSIADHRGG